MREYDINIPSITINSKEELIATIEDAIKNDDGIRYTAREVKQHLARCAELARA